MLLGIPLYTKNKRLIMTWYSVVLPWIWLIEDFMGDWRSTGLPSMGDIIILILMPTIEEKDHGKPAEPIHG